MSKVFYDHLVLIEEIWILIEALPISSYEKQKAKQMTEETMHYKILTVILDHLPKKHHEEFLLRFHSAPHDGAHLKFLQEKVDVVIHHEIAHAAEKLKVEVIKELKKHKGKGTHAHS